MMAVTREIPLRMILTETNQYFRVTKSRASVAFALFRLTGELGELVLVSNNLMPLHDKYTQPYHFYEAWLTAPQEGITASVGVFNTDPQGKGLLIYRFDPSHIMGHNLGVFRNLMITAEPQDGNAAPCTPVLV
jgi:hypothetical protein